MKEKILAALKTKYKTLGLSDKVLEGVATMLAATTTDEADIDNAVSGVEDLLKGFQSDADKRVTDALAKAKKDAETKQEDKGGEPAKEKEPAKTDDMPSWAKAMMDANKALADKLNALEQGKTVDHRKQALETKLKDADATFKAKVLKDFGRMQFENDDDFNSYLEDTVADAEAFGQTMTEKGLGGLGKPFAAAGATAEKKVDADIKEWAAQGAKTKTN